MRNSILFVDLGEEPVYPPFAINVSLHDIQDQVITVESAKDTDAYTMETYSVWGKFGGFRYTRYRVKKTIRIFSVPEQEVVTFHLQQLGDCTFSFGNRKEETWRSGEGYLFWQSRQIIEMTLPPGEHIHVDIFCKALVTPELWHQGRKIKLWKQKTEEVPDTTDFYKVQLENETREYMNVFMEKLRSFSVSANKLNLFCAEILGYYFYKDRDGVRKSIEHSLYIRGLDIPENQQQRSIYIEMYRDNLLRLQKLDRSRLISRFLYMRDKLLGQLDHFYRMKKILHQEEKHDAQAQSVCRESLDFCYETIHYLAKMIDTGELSLKQREWVRVCIISLQHIASQWKKPNSEQLAFYTDHCPPAPDEDMNIVHDFYNEVLGLLIEKVMDEDETVANVPNLLREGVICKDEQGFDSDIFPDRPKKEETEAYHRLRNSFEKYRVLFNKDWTDIAARARYNYIQGNYFALLLMEIHYLTPLPGYLDTLDDEILWWFLIALKSELNEQESRQRKLMKMPGYRIRPMNYIFDCSIRFL